MMTVVTHLYKPLRCQVWWTFLAALLVTDTYLVSFWMKSQVKSRWDCQSGSALP